MNYEVIKIGQGGWMLRNITTGNRIALYPTRRQALVTGRLLAGFGGRVSVNTTSKATPRPV